MTGKEWEEVVKLIVAARRLVDSTMLCGKGDTIAVKAAAAAVELLERENALYEWNNRFELARVFATYGLITQEIRCRTCEKVIAFNVADSGSSASNGR